MSALAETAARHAAAQVALGKQAAAELGRLWSQVDRGNIAASWRLFLPRALTVLSAAQALAASAADGYVDDALRADGAGDRVLPRAFAGVASDGRPLITLLQQPVFTALHQIGAGQTPDRALASGRFLLDAIGRTQVADAGRVAVGTAIAARPQATGYARLVVGRTCARCLILAGRIYRWNTGFARHPRCDCRHVPTGGRPSEGIITDPKAHFGSLNRAQQDALLGEAGATAVRSGADMAKVVNARRGMATAGQTQTRTRDDGQVVNVRHKTQATTQVAGRQIFTTTEAAGHRPRLMPEQIMREAKGDRAEAVRLLRLHGYLGR